MKYSTIIPVYMLLRAYSHSHYCNVRQSVWPKNLLCSCSSTNLQVAPIVCPSLQFHSNILHNNILQSILFVAMHEKRATVNATTD